ncbi:TetR family transcriptional regulator [Microtetraspora sp. NBRC 13810]|uniref:TetR/AcrR family transcriptional regulator C-terminal domain-containing protein n=1 Tax=Microtetraspora sp. NBRC 13810 TaxID=3030990 RepID=UPI0024A00AD2|nr:TetR/AcrR family transcriptional regulator C-terminal domain-containing protein [Microtetraspora sp. NBRC 13810]GLW12752.1 TetR family transcriptional regulator [Microtetraspora sp. NBRC 13810]
MGGNRGAGLTREMLIGTALRLLDEVGLAGLTVRRLAAELGVRSPALYWHIRTKQELLDGMAEAIVLEAGMGPPHDGESWQEWLARRARAYRGAVLAHRDGAQLVAAARRLSPATVRRFEEELAAMVALGFTPSLALRTITAFTYYINGSVLQEQTAAGETELSAEQLAALAGALEGGASSPFFQAVRDLGAPIGDQVFEHGLRSLIEGTAAELARSVKGDTP